MRDLDHVLLLRLSHLLPPLGFGLVDEQVSLVRGREHLGHGGTERPVQHRVVAGDEVSHPGELYFTADQEPQGEGAAAGGVETLERTSHCHVQVAVDAFAAQLSHFGWQVLPAP